MRQPGICKVSHGVLKTDQDLHAASYCRLCESTTPDYATAFTHGSTLGCMMLVQKYAISCPMCDDKSTYTELLQFFSHCKTHGAEFEVLIPPVKRSQYDIKRNMKDKAYSLLWMLQVCKKLYSGYDDSDKLFLPHLSTKYIASVSDCELTLCSYGVCLVVGQHEHKEDTDVDGTCPGCGNWHQFSGVGSLARSCKVAHYKGVLST